MNITMGGQEFRDIGIPILWGTRAIVQDQQQRLSVIDVSTSELVLEILGDKQAPNIDFIPLEDGFTIVRNGVELYSYYPKSKQISDVSLDLPDCQIQGDTIRIGTATISGNTFGGSQVGIAVSNSGMAMGTGLPPNLLQVLN